MLQYFNLVVSDQIDQRCPDTVIRTTEVMNHVSVANDFFKLEVSPGTALEF